MLLKKFFVLSLILLMASLNAVFAQNQSAPIDNEGRDYYTISFSVNFTDLVHNSTVENVTDVVDTMVPHDVSDQTTQDDSENSEGGMKAASIFTPKSLMSPNQMPDEMPSNGSSQLFSEYPSHELTQNIMNQSMKREDMLENLPEKMPIESTKNSSAFLLQNLMSKNANEKSVNNDESSEMPLKSSPSDSPSLNDPSSESDEDQEMQNMKRVKRMSVYGKPSSNSNAYSNSNTEYSTSAPASSSSGYSASDSSAPGESTPVNAGTYAAGPSSYSTPKAPGARPGNSYLVRSK